MKDIDLFAPTRGRPKSLTSITIKDVFRVYREPERDEHLVIFADPSEGAGSLSSAVATSKKHQDQPLIFNSRIDSAQLGYELHRVAKYIFHFTGIWPNIAIERNTGQATIHVLNKLNYPSLFRMMTFDTSTQKESEKIGWVMMDHSRRKILDDFALAVKQHIVKIYDKEVLQQMMAFVNKKSKSGVWRAEAESGKNDDLVICACGSWQIAMLVSSSELDEVDIDAVRKEREKSRFK